MSGWLKSQGTKRTSTDSLIRSVRLGVLAALGGCRESATFMIRPILKYGDRILHDPARDVDAITPEISRLIDDMIETMYAAPGVGLAAPQIGVPLRIFTVDVSVGRDPWGLLIFVNPEFVEREGMQLEEEGCLSVPGFEATVVRPARVVVKGLDRDGEPQRREGTALLARAFQHEMDHLDGTLFVDRLRGIKRELIVRRIKKLTRAGKW
jgi:peptide deformylase